AFLVEFDGAPSNPRIVKRSSRHKEASHFSCPRNGRQFTEGEGPFPYGRILAMKKGRSWPERPEGREYVRQRPAMVF
ncbi:hypothetical protein, partial [Adlercreutzia caecimuris]